MTLAVLLLQSLICLSSSEFSEKKNVHVDVHKEVLAPVSLTMSSPMTPVCMNNCSGNGICLASGICVCYKDFFGSDCSHKRQGSVNLEGPQQEMLTGLGSCTLEHKDCPTQLTIPTTGLVEGDIQCHVQHKKMLSDGSWQVEGQAVVEEGIRVSSDFLICRLPHESEWHKPDTTGRTHAFDITFSVHHGFRIAGGRYLIKCLTCPVAEVPEQVKDTPSMETEQPLDLYIALGVIGGVLAVGAVVAFCWMRRQRSRRRNQQSATESRM